MLVEGKAIRLHPLVCTAFNADFDGDQMAVHLPLSFEAQLEARVLMLASNNILSTANGRPIMSASQDMVLGCFYVTMGLQPEDEREHPLAFTGRDEVVITLNNGGVRLHETVKCRVNGETIETTPGRARSVQMRVGALPQEPQGALGYQLAFSPAGLINEYSEPCEILESGQYRTVDPLTRFETVEWDGWGPLEAFSTAGGTSTMCLQWQGMVDDLEYKTLRFPGHGRIFAAIREMGLFNESGKPAPRSVLIAALARTLPRGADDLVLARVWIETDRATRVLEIEDVHDGRFSALSRTTAFPATALIDLVLRDEISLRGVYSMQRAVDGALLVGELEPVGINVVERSR